MNSGTAETELDSLWGMSSISLGEMDAIRLMNRIDTKYLTDVLGLSAVLEKAAACGYLVLEEQGLRIQRYRSMYYDTPELQMYLDHHNKRLVRQKLRTRCYVDSGLTFLELKSKNNHGRTKKKRIEVAEDKYWLHNFDDRRMLDWLDGRMHYDLRMLTPSLETVFRRITLVNPERTERSTIDLDLSFCNVRKGTAADMAGLAVIEVKQDGAYPSVFRDILLECRVKPVRISKYCIGTALTDSSVRSGRFKEKMMIINKMKI